MHPDAPPHDRNGEPLEGDGRGIKHQPLHRADLRHGQELLHARAAAPGQEYAESKEDRKSTRLNSSHSQISYAVFCLKKKKTDNASCHLPRSEHTEHTATA